MFEQPDLRKLNPKEGDLVLLINRDFEWGEPYLLTVFSRFLKDNEIARDTTVKLLGKEECKFNARRIAYLKPSINFSGKFIPDIEHLSTRDEFSYIPEEIYVGVQQIIDVLKKEKGYEIYASILAT